MPAAGLMGPAAGTFTSAAAWRSYSAAFKEASLLAARRRRRLIARREGALEHAGQPDGVFPISLLLEAERLHSAGSDIAGEIDHPTTLGAAHFTQDLELPARRLLHSLVQRFL